MKRQPFTKPLVITVTALSLTLASCAHTPQSPIHPPRPDPSICAAVPDEPKLPNDAGLVQPVTDEEKAAFSAFMGWSFVHADWGRQMAERVRKTVASPVCK